MTARYSAEDYAAAATALLPRGRVWPGASDPDSEQAAMMTSLGQSFERSDAAASQLLVEGLPGGSTDLLVEWEATLGLPDPCAGPNPTVAQRQAQVRARFIAGGGQSRDYLVAFCAALGFTVELVNYAPFRAGRSTVGNPVASDAWTFVLGVRVLANATGLSTDVLLCELRTIAAAETTILLLS